MRQDDEASAPSRDIQHKYHPLRHVLSQISSVLWSRIGLISRWLPLAALANEQTMSSPLRRATHLAILSIALVLAGCASNKSAGNLDTTGSGVSAPTLKPAGSSPVAIGTVLVSPSALVAVGAQPLTETATDTGFSQSALVAHADRGIVLTFTNHGTSSHDWHLIGAADPDGRAIKTGIVPPGQSESIDFELRTPGVYHFQGDAAPNVLKGTLTIAPATPVASPAAATTSSALTLHISTPNKGDDILYDKAILNAPPDTEVTVIYTKYTNIAHNWHLFDGSSAEASTIAQTPIKSGPGDVESVTFKTPANPGSYFFHCDVHPTQMVGHLIVK